MIHNSKNSGMARSEQLNLNWLLSDCVNSNMKRHQRSTSVAGMPLDLVYDPRKNEWCAHTVCACNPSEDASE